MDRAVFHGFVFPNMHIQFQSREVFELNRSINNKLKKRVGKKTQDFTLMFFLLSSVRKNVTIHEQG